MEVETAARKRLLEDDTVKGYVVQKVFRHRLEEPILGTGGRAIVIRRGPGWAAPDPVKTSEFPTLWIDAYADPDRDIDGSVAELNGEDKALALQRVVKRLIHGVREERWGGANGLMIVTCATWQETQILRDKDMHRGEQPLGDTVIARGRYALQIAPTG